MLLDILKFAEIIIAIVMIVVILVQNKNVTLNLSSMGGGMTGGTTRRGQEKILHNMTIILGSLFTLNSMALYLLS